MNELIKMLKVVPKETLFIPVGIAGSGKSTIRNFISSVIPNLKIVSPDEIRFEILDFPKSGKSFDPEIEPEVWKKAYNQLQVFLTMKVPIFFDATNLTYSRRMALISMAREKKYTIYIHEVFINPHLAYLRSLFRGRTVSLDVILKQFESKDSIKSEEFDIYTSQYQMPTEEELKNLDSTGWKWWQF